MQRVCLGGGGGEEHQAVAGVRFCVVQMAEWRREELMWNRQTAISAAGKESKLQGQDSLQGAFSFGALL